MINDDYHHTITESYLKLFSESSQRDPNYTLPSPPLGNKNYLILRAILHVETFSPSVGGGGGRRWEGDEVKHHTSAILPLLLTTSSRLFFNSSLVPFYVSDESDTCFNPRHNLTRCVRSELSSTPENQRDRLRQSFNKPLQKLRLLALSKTFQYTPTLRLHRMINAFSANYSLEISSLSKRLTKLFTDSPASLTFASTYLTHFECSCSSDEIIQTVLLHVKNLRVLDVSGSVLDITPDGVSRAFRQKGDEQGSFITPLSCSETLEVINFGNPRGSDGTSAKSPITNTFFDDLAVFYEASMKRRDEVFERKIDQLSHHHHQPHTDTDESSALMMKDLRAIGPSRVLKQLDVSYATGIIDLSPLALFRKNGFASQLRVLSIANCHKISVTALVPGPKEEWESEEETDGDTSTTRSASTSSTSPSGVKRRIKCVCPEYQYYVDDAGKALFGRNTIWRNGNEDTLQHKTASTTSRIAFSSSLSSAAAAATSPHQLRDNNNKEFENWSVPNLTLESLNLTQFFGTRYFHASSDVLEYALINFFTCGAYNKISDFVRLRKVLDGETRVDDDDDDVKLYHHYLPTLKSLDLSCLATLSSRALRVILRSCPNLTTLRFDSHKYQNEGTDFDGNLAFADFFVNSPNSSATLHTLTLRHGKVPFLGSVENFRNFSQGLFSRLHRLDLSYFGVSGRQSVSYSLDNHLSLFIEAQQSTPSLQHLNVAYAQGLSGRGFRNFSKTLRKTLRILDISGCKITANEFEEHLGGLTFLKSLSVKECAFLNADQVCEIIGKRFPYLRELNISDVGMKDLTDDGVKHLRRLVVDHQDNDGDQETALSSIIKKGGGQLKFLSMCGYSTLTISSILFLTRIPSASYHSLTTPMDDDENDETDDDDDVSQQQVNFNHTLEELHVSHCENMIFDDSMYEIARSFKNLQVFRFRNSKYLTPQGLRYLKRMNSLRLIEAAGMSDLKSRLIEEMCTSLIGLEVDNSVPFGDGDAHYGNW